jgi:hypothetical protein
LFDRRRGKPSPKKVPLAVVEKVLGRYREKYFDLKVRHFPEKLQEEHQVEISYSWGKGLLQGAGMVAKGRKRGVHRQQRPRRPLPGMLLHIDGSEHRWFQDERWYDVLGIMDDANSEIYYAQLVEEEATVPVLTGLKDCACVGSGRWWRPMPFCASITSGSSIVASKSKRRNRAVRLCPIGAKTWSASFRCNSSAR